MLGRARWMGRAPLLGILTYLAAGWSVLAALGLAGLTVAVHATALGGGLSQVIGACVRRLRALYAAPGGATVAELGLILAAAAAPPTSPPPVCPPPPAHPPPPPAVRAAATDGVHRIHRLLRPAEPLSRPRPPLLRAPAALLALAPVLVALAPAVAALALGRVPAA